MNAWMGRGGLFDELFKDVNPGFYAQPLHGGPLPSAGPTKVDVKENEGGSLFSAEMPGEPMDQIQVSMDRNLVTLRAEVRQRGDQDRW